MNLLRLLACAARFTCTICQRNYSGSGPCPSCGWFTHQGGQRDGGDRG